MISDGLNAWAYDQLRKAILIVLVVGVVGFSVGFMVGYLL